MDKLEFDKYSARVLQLAYRIAPGRELEPDPTIDLKRSNVHAITLCVRIPRQQSFPQASTSNYPCLKRAP
jgi:hypothetical protein